MMLKTISIVLSEKMIQEIDEKIFDEDFGSRSEFFRHIVRIWLKSKSAKIENHDTELSKNEFEEINLTFGIPSEIVKQLEEKAKFLN